VTWPLWLVVGLAAWLAAGAALGLAMGQVLQRIGRHYPHPRA
jgi:hypothetical protein